MSRASRTKETLPDFHEWCRVTRHLRLFRRLTGCQRTPEFWGVTTFLDGDLDEKIYMEQPEGFIVPGQEKKVCWLIKSLYGLKQAPKQWHEKFDRVMMVNGFKINKCDKCVYVKNTERGSIIICLYVDDMLIMGSNNEVIKTTKKMFNNKFNMKDLGVADVILGLKISKTLDE